MIFVRDKGRMCNNILQYGHVYAWAREHGRCTISMRFCYKYQYFKICSTPYHWFLTYVLVKSAAFLHLLPVASFDNKHNEDALELMSRKKNLIVEGWYVRFYDLFLKYKAEIIDLFSFNKSIESSVNAYIRTTSEKESLRLGVHVRRGDYKTWHNGRYYYEDSVYCHYIKQFAALCNNKRITVYICGNDPTLDKKYYQEQLRELTICFPEGNPGEDLCLLSKCDYLIGAPSTFSLVASMYRNLPLYWIQERHNALTISDFKKFDVLFQHIL